MINLKNVYSNVAFVPKMLSESKKSHLKHLFEDGTLCFDDFRSIFNDVFSGSVGMTTNVKKIPLAITFKNGAFAFSDGKDTVKDPCSVEKICRKCKCSVPVKRAVLKTLNEFTDSFNKFDQVDLNSIFANGQNYYNFDIVIPSESCLPDYNNRCFIVCNKVNSYDNEFKNIVEDEENTNKIADRIKVKNLTINNPEISIDNIEKLKKSTTPETALKLLSDDLAKIVDGIGYKATVNDYVKERYAKYIVNCAMKNGIDLYHNSNFVNELISRLSYVSNHRPTRSDLMTYAKRDGIDCKSQNYVDFLNYLESTAKDTNNAIIKPIEDLVMKAGVLLIKCLYGLVATDPRCKYSKIANDLDSSLKCIECCPDGLTPDIIKTIRKNTKILDDYQTTLPEDGFMFMKDGKVFNVCGKIGKISNLAKLMNY